MDGDVVAPNRARRFDVGPAHTDEGADLRGAWLDQQRSVRCVSVEEQVALLACGNCNPQASKA